MQSFNRYLPKISIGLAGVALIALAVIVLTPSPAPAQPVISWVPESLNEVVLAGETKTVSVSFTAAQALGAVEVRVVPELEPYVTTNPTSFTSITAGQTITLDITISAPADASPSTVEGTIQIRNAGRPPRNFARPLPVTIEVWAAIREKGLTLGYPSNWSRNTRFTESNDPIELNTFNSNYGQGGVVPKEDAVITILQTALSVDNAISRDSVENTIISTDTISVNSNSSTRVVYSISFEPLFTYSNIIVYVPQGNSLYKFSLLYRDGTAHESEFLSNFQTILDTVQFIR